MGFGFGTSCAQVLQLFTKCLLLISVLIRMKMRRDERLVLLVLLMLVLRLL